MPFVPKDGRNIRTKYNIMCILNKMVAAMGFAIHWKLTRFLEL